MMRRGTMRLAIAAAAAMMVSGCGLVTSTNRSVFFIFDASGTYVKAVPAAAQTASIAIAQLQPGDWIGASQISSCSFSEKEIILQEQLPETPSRAAQAQREIFTRLKSYADTVKKTGYTDIRGALAQAAFELKQRPEAARYIVLFSDMVEDFAPNCDTSGADLDLSGITVLASNVVKSTPNDPDAYFANLKTWEETVTKAGGSWRVVSSPDQLPALITGQ
jgi:hypothetical protein